MKSLGLSSLRIKTIYYAHSLRIYNTEQEQLELKQIAELCPSREIINPNGMVDEIKEAYQLIDKSDGVVASEYQGHIGKGVHDEICHALSKKKVVVMLHDGRLFRVYSEHQIEVLDVDCSPFQRGLGGCYPIRINLSVKSIAINSEGQCQKRKNESEKTSRC